MHGDMVGIRRCAASTGPFSALSWAGSSWIVRVCLARAIHSHDLAGDGSRERPKRWLWRPVAANHASQYGGSVLMSIIQVLEYDAAVPLMSMNRRGGSDHYS